MHPHKELLQLLQAGQRPTITFQKAVTEDESYAEPGMKGRVVSATAQPDDTLRFVVDYTDFESHNQTLEEANYYDKDGYPTLTARQAGFYSPQETFYATVTDSTAALFQIDAEPGSALYARYLTETNGATPYVAWLESEVLRLSPVV